MWRVYGGAIMVIAGIAALIEANRHHPDADGLKGLDVNGEHVLGRFTLTGPGSGWSRTAYDLVRIGAWALVLLGAVTLIVGLIRYRQRARGAA